MRCRCVAAHTCTYFLEFFVTGFGHVFGHLAGLAFVGALGLCDHQQMAAVRRQRAVDDLHLIAQIHRRCRTRGIGAAPGIFLRAQRVALLLVATQGGQRRQLLIAQHIGLWGGVGVALGLDHRHLRGAAVGAPVVPVVARAPDRTAVAGELRTRFDLVAAGQLGQRTCAQIAQEDVAVTCEQHALAGGIVTGVCRIQAGARGIGHTFGSATAGALAIGVAHRAAIALEQVLHLFAVPLPPGLIHRRPDPVRVGHRLFDGERGGRLRMRSGGQQQKGQRQQSRHRTRLDAKESAQA